MGAKTLVVKLILIGLLGTGCGGTTTPQPDSGHPQDAQDEAADTLTDGTDSAASEDGDAPETAEADDGGDAGSDAGEPSEDAGVDAGTDQEIVDAGTDASDTPDASDETGDWSFDEPDVVADAGYDAGFDAGADEPPQDPCVRGEFFPVFGQMHSHTSYSDGEQTPADAFAFARNMTGMQVMFVTDHLERLYLFPPTDRYGKCKEQANAANIEGTFVAECGFEYGTGFFGIESTGHNNVFYSQGLFPAVQFNFLDFYQSVKDCPTCLVQFNHPGDEPLMHWNHFKHDPGMDPKTTLFEFKVGRDPWAMFILALDNGWHVSPTTSEDNHSPDWGISNNRTGYYVEALTRAGVRDALEHRRTFMTQDRNATIRLLGNEVCWMGSILTGVPELRVDAEASDPEATDAFVSLEFFGPTGALLVSVACAGGQTCAGSLTVTVTAPTYVFARATQADGNILISAPLWASP